MIGRITFLTLCLCAGACEPRHDPLAPRTQYGESPDLVAARRTLTNAPEGLVTISLPAGQSLQLWPFTGNDFSGSGQDPINLIFVGQADPRALRAALFTLSGDRTAFGFPIAFPFNCTWRDAIGDVETGYAADAGWVGSTVQLACGDYGPLRFHLRLFREGGRTIANAHFEVLVPGTADHQVLSWELAEQFVTVDMLRSGLLDSSVPLSQTGAINPSPYRSVPAVIYNGLPVELRAAIGGPTGDVGADVPIATDGHATILNVAGSVPLQPGQAVQDFDLTYGQVIPKPFCATGPLDYVLVQGPVHLHQVVTLAPNGDYRLEFHAAGRLDVTPMDVTTSPPVSLGPALLADIEEQHKSAMSDETAQASSFVLRVLTAPSQSGGGRFMSSLDVGTSHDAANTQVRCGGSL